MPKKSILSIGLLLILLFGFTLPVSAANYSFSLNRLVVVATITKDGTMTIDYNFDFTNDASAGPIDYIDVGIPVNDYDLKSITAEVNGQPITDIQKSTYIDIGVALGLGTHAIQPGQHGQVHVFIGIVRSIVYPYTNNDKKDYASFNFSPAWFDSSIVHGSTDETVTLRLPPGVTADEPVYYNPESWPGESSPQSGFDQEGRIFYTWHTPQANGSTQYKFGAAFPVKYVPAAAIVHEAPISFNLENWIFPCCLCGFGLLFIWGIYQGTVGARKRKLQYLPPKISVEGHGIKRGLTAVEAAILMEQPMDKILTMILFGVIKKNAVSVVTHEPLKLEILQPTPPGLNPYETEFIQAFTLEKLTDQKLAVQKMMVNLVKSIGEKMKGFSQKETIAYYQDIMKKAWEQVETAGTPEVKSSTYDQVMEWTMLDHDYSNRTRNIFSQGPVFVPIWWGHYDPVFRGAVGPINAPAATAAPMNVSMPHLPGSDFAASLINGAQNFSSTMIGDVTSFTSGITNITNPPPPPSSTGRYGGGGGHCACACACAGCACACAGGGR